MKEVNIKDIIKTKYEREISVIGKYLQKVLDVKFSVYINRFDNDLESYNDGKNIFLNYDWIENMDDKDSSVIICFLSIEGFHLYQKKKLEDNSLSHDILEQWKEELSIEGDNSKWTEDEREFYKNNYSIEQTAYIFADRVIDALAAQRIVGIEKYDKSNFDIVESLKLDFIY